MPDQQSSHLAVRNPAGQFCNHDGLFWPNSAVICFFGFLFSFIAYYPGSMTWDSFEMWNMGSEWKFRTWHSPLIAVLMAAGRYISGDPGPYLFFQLALWWSGAYIFSLALRNQIGKVSILASFIGFLPFNISLSGYLHKTPLSAACFLFSCSWLFLLYTRGRQLSMWHLVILLPVLFLGSVVREFSLIAVVPVLIFMFSMFVNKLSSRFKLLSILALTVLTVSGFAILHNFLVFNVLDAQKKYKSVLIYKFDLAGIYALSGKAYGERFLAEAFKDHDMAQKEYFKQKGLWKIVHIYGNIRNIDEIRELKSEWRRGLSENFSTYLKHKTNAIIMSLGILNPASNFRELRAQSLKNTYRIKKWDTIFYQCLKFYQRTMKNMFFMQPWFWVLLNLILSLTAIVLYFGKKVRQKVLPHFVMLWSGLFVSPYLLVCISSDARFTYWVTVATSFGGFGLLGIFFHRRHEQRQKKIVNAG